MLVVLTLGCVLFGWQVERRRQLMVAAHEVLANSCSVHSFHTDMYGLPYDLTQLVTRFWDSDVLPSAVCSYFQNEQKLAQISRLTTIETLIFRSDDATDDWFRHLEPLQNLRELYLDCPKLTDRVIPHICNLRQLQDVSMTPSGITREGFLRLRRALPNCAFTIYWELPKDSEHYLPLNGRMTGLGTEWPAGSYSP
jgi:hypothetical protein